MSTDSLGRCGPVVAGLLAAVCALGTGCRHPARPGPAPATPATAVGDYCWWSVFRTPLPPDTVAARFARAFTGVGLTGATWSRLADTASAHAGPTALAGRGGATYAARVVAFRRGDTTLFRHFVAVTPPLPGRGAPGDALNPAGLHIGFCGELGRAAAVHGAAPREPNGEEALPVWSRRQ